jgi:hypothetical protein
MPDNKPRWRVVCSCGWERKCVSEWAAESVSRLHQQLGVLRVEHATTSSSRWSREPWSRRTSVTVLIQRLLVALASAAALAGCATALVTKDDALSKEAPASAPASPASRSPSDFGSSAPHWFGTP